MGDIILRSRKVVVAWAVAADLDPGQLNPGHFLIGDRSYPEIDRVEWFTPEGARRKLNQAQGVFIDRLVEHLQNEHQTS